MSDTNPNVRWLFLTYRGPLVKLLFDNHMFGIIAIESTYFTILYLLEIIHVLLALFFPSFFNHIQIIFLFFFFFVDGTDFQF